MRKENKTIKIADLWLASALSLTLKIEPELEKEGDVIVCMFPFSAETMKAIHDLTSGAIKFDYLTYSERVKNLKSKMINMKRLVHHQPK